MKHKILGKVWRRCLIRFCFKIFFKEVTVTRASKEDVSVVCKYTRINQSMLRESLYHKGLDTVREQAYMASHFLHAYFWQYGVTVGTPYGTEQGIQFFVYDAYRKGLK